ncbi:MAG: FHA domain-containing protein [Candidatus Baltobacteraceae bacterium]
MDLRLGSLAILGALALFGAVASKVRTEPPELPAPERAMAVDLTVNETARRGGKREVRLRLEPGSPQIIGRSSDAAVGVLDPEVSRRHASLRAVGGVVYLADLGSVNGTFLSGKRAGTDGIEVLAGDVIDVGTTRMTVSAIEPA